MLIHHIEGNARKMTLWNRVGSGIFAIVMTYFAFFGWTFPEKWPALAIGLGFTALSSAVVEIRFRTVLTRAGKPVLDFKERTFLYYRRQGESPEEISYAEILTYYVSTGDGETPALLTIEFKKRRRIKIQTDYVDIDPQRLLALIKFKLEGALA